MKRASPLITVSSPQRRIAELMHAPLLIAAAADHGNHAAHLSWFQAVVLGAVQGVTELFPISSLGHTVLLPTLFGWTQLVKDQSDPESFWLALVVMLHVGSALGLLAYFWRDWVAIIRAFFVSLWRRRIETPTEKLAWLIIAASIPVGVIGLALEHPLRVLFAKPTAAAIFLMVNGLILLGAERLRRRAPARAAFTPDAFAYAGAGPDPGGGRVRPSVPGSGSAGPVAPLLLEAGNAPAADESAELSADHVPQCGRDRLRAVNGADRRHQPRRGLYVGRPAVRPRQRDRRPVRVPAGDADHPGRRHLQALRPDRPAGQRDPSPGRGRVRLSRRSPR